MHALSKPGQIPSAIKFVLVVGHHAGPSSCMHIRPQPSQDVLPIVCTHLLMKLSYVTWHRSPYLQICAPAHKPGVAMGDCDQALFILLHATYSPEAHTAH